MAAYNPIFTAEELQSEIWKTIPSLPDYEASNIGRLRRRVWKSGAPKLGRIMAPTIHTSGYLFYCLRDASGKKRNVYAHIPVAEAFLGPKSQGFEVNHKDGNKLNNRIANLEYVTSSENQKHAFQLGLQVARKGEDCSWAKLTDQQVLQIYDLLEENQLTQYELADRFGVPQQTISDIKNGRSWKHLYRPLHRRRVTTERSRGEACHHALLTRDTVIKIKAMKAQGKPVRAIARRFGVSRGAIYGILKGKSWKHVK